MAKTFCPSMTGGFACTPHPSGTGRTDATAVGSIQRTATSSTRSAINTRAATLTDGVSCTLTADASSAANGLVRYSGEVPLDQPGPFGYTVRLLPNHPLLDSRAELGLVTYPQAPAGMTNGDLR